MLLIEINNIRNVIACDRVKIVTECDRTLPVPMMIKTYVVSFPKYEQNATKSFHTYVDDPDTQQLGPTSDRYLSDA